MPEIVSKGHRLYCDELLAARDRRIAELENQIAELAAVVQVNVSPQRMSAMTRRSLSVLDSIKIKAKREALEEAARRYEVEGLTPYSRTHVAAFLRRMAREVKP